MTQSEAETAVNAAVDHIVETLNDRLNHEKQRLVSVSNLFNAATHYEDKLRLLGKMNAYTHGIELLTDLLRDLT